ncbi:uncharacterized protein [Pyxicephalus adspersus]|uniref:uncharacterized protein n=1 Tax=Pyxicephalus adspersus TaxID=30357 RepID=UPI003B5B2811
MNYYFPTLCLIEMTLYVGTSGEDSHLTSLEVTVTKPSRVILNCSLNLPKLQRYSLCWNISNKTGYHTEKLFVLHGTPIQENISKFSMVIEEAKVGDEGVYKCSLQKTLPPPSKTYYGPLIRLIVQAPPKMHAHFVQNGEDEIIVVCNLLEFYPERITANLSMTCEESLKIKENSTLERNADGSVNVTYMFWMNISHCSNNPSVTCEADHVTGKVKQTISLISGYWKNHPTVTGTDISLTAILIIKYSLMIFLSIVFLVAITVTHIWIARCSS